ncbi:hypothetical protein Q4575_14910 [Psychrosphaera sp. 1_MG-2023]|uniref:TolB family protein n=1 Tax=Psychrosphaera sp. 1_MG-2023 TaxID=3062643 RepID=UPI0026E47C84|nr:hypothetical protein [Psychrosphaera sp. 1_MG-2023]MDO6720702.1 hypothetical protein [Psychrosphaera sp. 1_MG-2023]
MIKNLGKFALLSISTFLPITYASTDIFVAQIATNGQKTHVVEIDNITQRPGYDNQPYFADDGSGVYYTSQLAQQTDILFYNLSSKTLTNITKTLDTSEYSPTLVPESNNLSFIKVEPDSTQRLWTLTLGSQKQTIINKTIKPVGYHAWGADNDLALFVLGEPMTLQYIQSPEQENAKVIANEIGRALHYNAKHQVFSFTTGTNNALNTFSAQTGIITQYLALPKETQDYTWLNSDQVIAAMGTKIMVWSLHTPNQTWQPLFDFSNQCPTNITRLAVNKSASKLAFVCDEETQ